MYLNSINRRSAVTSALPVPSERTEHASRSGRSPGASSPTSPRPAAQGGLMMIEFVVPSGGDKLR
jgi:hypothetical protein